MESQNYYGVNPSRFDSISGYVGDGAVWLGVKKSRQKGSGKLFMCIMMRH